MESLGRWWLPGLGLATAACGPDVAPTSGGETPGSEGTAVAGAATVMADGFDGGRTGPMDGSWTSAPSSEDDAPTDPATSTTTTSNDSEIATSTPTTSTSETSDAATTTGSPVPCGNGDLDPGEECDDGNTDDADACTAACTVAFCGDGIVWLAQEECDDGNADEADACTTGCVERFPVVYLTIFEEHYDMWRYSAEDDTWETLTGPDAYRAGLAWDGDTLYIGEWGTGAIYRYDAPADAWELHTLGPAGLAGLDGSYPRLVWAGDAFYMVLELPSLWAPNSFWAYRDETWSEIVVDAGLSAAGDWDPVAQELYVRKDGELGFLVVDTTTDQIVRETDDPTVVAETTRDGSFLDGFLYAVPWGGPLTRLDGQTGAASDTGVTPTSLVPATTADRYKRQIYLAGFGPYANHFERYDADEGTLTELAPVPTEPYTSSGHTNILVVYPAP